MKSTRLTCLLLAPPLFGLVACGSGAAGGQALTTVNVVHAPTTIFAPLYIADGKGYFAEQGIKVQLQTVKAGSDAIPLAASGRVDVVVGGFSAGLFNSISSGLDIKIVGSMEGSESYTDRTGPAPTALEVSKSLQESGKVRTPADLKGRKVALAGGAGGAAGYLLDTILRQNGLALRDVTPVNLTFPDMQAALQSGAVDAAVTPPPFTTIIESSGVATPLALPPAGTAATGVMYGGKFVKDPAARKFFKALQKGAADLQNGQVKSDTNLQILATYTGQKPEVLKNSAFYAWDPDLAPRTSQIAAQQQAYLDAGLLNYKQPLATEKIIDPTFAMQR